jgi:hypothetical protein
MESLNSSETVVNLHRAIWRYTSEDGISHAENSCHSKLCRWYSVFELNFFRDVENLMMMWDLLSAEEGAREIICMDSSCKSQPTKLVMLIKCILINSNTETLSSEIKPLWIMTKWKVYNNCGHAAVMLSDLRIIMHGNYLHRSCDFVLCRNIKEVVA